MDLAVWICRIFHRLIFFNFFFKIFEFVSDEILIRLRIRHFNLMTRNLIYMNDANTRNTDLILYLDSFFLNYWDFFVPLSSFWISDNLCAYSKELFPCLVIDVIINMHMLPFPIPIIIKTFLLERE